MANEYATLSELKQALELTGETFADADINRALEAASRSIDQATGRRFYPDTDANQIRHFGSERSCKTLPIHDLIELTALAVDRANAGTFPEAWTLNTDFVLLPLNSAADSRPWTLIETIRLRRIPLGERTVKITGKWGWAAAPPEVKQATLILAAKLVKRSREAPFGVVTGFDGGEATRIARSDPDVRMLIGPYMHVVG